MVTVLNREENCEKSVFCVVDKKHPNCFKGWHKLGVFLSFQTSILKKCHERAEKWADDVLRRLLSSIDVVPSDAIYHGLCESFFFYKKNVYLQETETEHTVGHPADNAMKSNFEFWILSELHAKICSFAEKNLTVYCLQFFEPGRSKVVCSTFYRYCKYHIIRAMVQIYEITITAAANLIKNKIIRTLLS